MAREVYVAPLTASTLAASASSVVFPSHAVSNCLASSKKSGVSEFCNASTFCTLPSFIYTFKGTGPAYPCTSLQRRAEFITMVPSDKVCNVSMLWVVVESVLCALKSCPNTLPSLVRAATASTIRQVRKLRICLTFCGIVRFLRD